MSSASVRRLGALFLAAALPMGSARAVAPGEVSGIRFAAPATLTWNLVNGADHFNVYRGDLAGLAAGQPARCHAFDVAGASFATAAAPESGNGYYYLVAAESAASEEGSAGVGSGGSPHPLLGSCTGVMRGHVLDRTGFGWSEWSETRIAALGIDDYIESQLDPLSISESSNFDLNSRLASITPAETLSELAAQQVIRGTYARRQLEQQLASFWANHFSTFWLKIEDYFNELFPECDSPGVPPQCDPVFPNRSQIEASLLEHFEIERFRPLALYGNFREMVEASAISPAMLVYLDMILSVAGNPNENFARELMELHTMGVDAGYTQQDVEQLSRALTGWNVCKKTLDDLDDPLAPCIVNYWDHNPAGYFTANFTPALHDCTAKTLFSGTPHEFTIADTCADLPQGLQDLFVALDHIVAHPSTPRFISGKILEKFVAEDLDPTAIDALVDAWNDPTNPNGIGDLQAVMRAAFSRPEFHDPDRLRTKIKTPLEHAVSAMRATRSRTNGANGVQPFLAQSNYELHMTRDPTGWPEAGFHWINTNAMLDRQNFAFNLLQSSDPNFAAQPLLMLQQAGVSTFPGNAAGIVDFFARAFFGGALTQAERQVAIDYLNTDDTGQPSNYDEQRIREMVALLLGYPHFQEQ